jgi:hypothetical protein
MIVTMADAASVCRSAAKRGLSYDHHRDGFAHIAPLGRERTNATTANANIAAVRGRFTAHQNPPSVHQSQDGTFVGDSGQAANGRVAAVSCRSSMIGELFLMFGLLLIKRPIN